MKTSEIPMGLSLLLCDTIIQDIITGKRSLIGLFSQIHAPKLPCIHSSMMVLVSVTGGQGSYPCELICEHPELQEPVFRKNFTLNFENPFQVVDMTFNLKNIVFKLPGKYEIKVIIDGVPELIRPLMVSLKKPATQENPDQKQEN
ncbi:MAG: hypothetical protein K5787_15720 [Lentisphaeria bacterium]|nr:hypothetical protein [Lentisphaeria bacterium]